MTNSDPASIGRTMETIRALEKTISRVLEMGINVSSDTLFFAESTYGIADEMLVSALRDSSFEGKEPLTELIFTPDSAVRRAVEPLLPTQGMNNAEIEDLTAMLTGKFKTIDLVMHGGSARYAHEIERDSVNLFVHKLYLDRALDDKVAAALEQTVSPAAVIAARVMMRCRGDGFGERKREFLCRFIRRSTSYEDRFVELLGITLTLLAEMRDGQPVEAYFLQKKRALVSKLKEIRICNEKRDQYAMEYLMMQRFRIPHESEEETCNQLVLLTTITDVILGLPPDPALRVESKDLGRFDTETDLEHLIRTLSRD